MSRFGSARARVALPAVGLVLVAGTAFAAVGGQSNGQLVVDASPVIRVRVDSPVMFQQRNSGGSAPVLVAQGLVPGESRSGSVTITNAGALEGRYRLTASDLTDAAGPNGGVLSAHLRLSVDETTALGTTRIHDGTLAGLSTVDLGIFARAESRTYTFTVTLPSGGVPASATSGDNAFQGSASSVKLSWSGVSCPC